MVYIIVLPERDPLLGLLGASLVGDHLFYELRSVNRARALEKGFSLFFAGSFEHIDLLGSFILLC
ncbi:uncharacterized protein PHALS_08960 [Plasmopara halstedii]|uniref:Uncharacterized protein n=1 Tax=Plasmopara halstedii TaxID=4781 RepID=A0A0P1ADC1_PLAHL|nr:uncharacterized protein PHALS_08960 [Plasmopara halstedii]CEG38914.1 hypothetical protein PHALS_08960 [Plasmopara halstedii]|eukprot:XP_024575283.1 hypothetical protein PHALS_08960 [Plasmopara halstedii]